MKKKSVAQKRQDIQALLSVTTKPSKDLRESEVNAETVETEVAKATTAKEKVLTQAERVDQDKNKKIDEALEKEFDSVEDAIQESQKEIDWGKDKIATYKQAETIFDAVMKQAKNQSSCLACGRDIKEESSTSHGSDSQGQGGAGQTQEGPVEARARGADQSKQARGYVRQLTESESAVQSYIQSRGEQRLQACSDALTKLQGQIRTIQNDISGIESEVAKIEKDLNESRATERNIHDNLRYLALGRDIERIDSEMAGLQLEEASKANKIWSEKFNVSKRKENELNGEASHLAGENTSLKATIKSREQELRDEYKNVHGRYTAKLIDVKFQRPTAASWLSMSRRRIWTRRTSTPCHRAFVNSSTSDAVRATFSSSSSPRRGLFESPGSDEQLARLVLSRLERRQAEVHH
ncbi:hypothetical protein L7F22_044855 [Adiantum nelumboides]|nr:hypothetical protein [Adiantum nelumboides]